MFGLATFSYANADAAGRRLAAVQLVTTKIASLGEVASAFGSPATPCTRASTLPRRPDAARLSQRYVSN